MNSDCYARAKFSQHTTAYELLKEGHAKSFTIHPPSSAESSRHNRGRRETLAGLAAITSFGKDRSRLQLVFDMSSRHNERLQQISSHLEGDLLKSGSEVCEPHASPCSAVQDPTSNVKAELPSSSYTK